MRNLGKDFPREEANEQYTGPAKDQGGGSSKPTVPPTKTDQTKRFVYIGLAAVLLICVLIYFLTR